MQANLQANRGTNEEKQDMSIHGIGIIGYGAFGRFLHHSWKKSDLVKVAAVFSAAPIKEPLPGITIHADWRDLINDPAVDIVSIATPPSSHCETACAAMEAGKHVLVEKPMATTIEDGRRIIDTRNATGKVASVNFMMRFNPLVEALGELSREGVFGELRRADVENYAQDSALPRDHWFWDLSISGGILIEHAVHFIDVVNSLTDQKHQFVTGFSHFRNEKQQDKVLASVLYDRGLIATHYHAFAYPGFFESTSIRLAFDLATIDIEGWIPLKGTITAMVNSRVKGALLRLPGFKITTSRPVDLVEDQSRPEGWGDLGGIQSPINRISSFGNDYSVEEMVRGSFDIGRSKAEVYSECVLDLMHDLVKAIETPAHRPRISLEEALSALDIACSAAKWKSMHCSGSQHLQ
jgi:predicted dehydrogenase